MGWNPADVAYIMAFGITALLTTVVVVVEVFEPFDRLIAWWRLQHWIKKGNH
jgi:hypothetical protein